MRLLPLLILVLPSLCFAKKSHIEYGAGNYHGFSESRNPHRQYEILYRTLDNLVLDYGPNEPIDFYVNDIEPEAALYAADMLKEYADRKGYKNVQVFLFVGDALKKRWLPRTNTAHFKNPETGILRKENVKALQRLADYSENGLEITTYLVNEFGEIKEGLPVTNRGPGELYIFPDGKRVEHPTERYLLSPQQKLSSQDWQVGVSRAIGNFQAFCSGLYREAASFVESLGD